ncbi:ATP-binding protein [Actinoplanes philippinensis]|uniref:ATP-binding protein n=1 Tax=Actinoplanes philippinensis TaxID=35752 RepID=UPI000B811AF6|nr:ATP-binding protein [Actinoplanes philippinensis]
MTELLTSPPPPQADGLHAWALSDSTELRSLRARLRQAVNAFAATDGAALDEIAENMVLVATELATNAIRHGLPPVTVRLLHTADQFVIDVADHDLSAVPELAGTRPPGAGGRGLHLARALSLQVGWYATDTTKHVWACFPIHP